MIRTDFHTAKIWSPRSATFFSHGNSELHHLSSHQSTSRFGWFPHQLPTSRASTHQGRPIIPWPTLVLFHEFFHGFIYVASISRMIYLPTKPVLFSYGRAWFLLIFHKFPFWWQKKLTSHIFGARYKIINPHLCWWFPTLWEVAFEKISKQKTFNQQTLRTRMVNMCVCVCVWTQYIQAVLSKKPWESWKVNSRGPILLLLVIGQRRGQ